jgi:hypothetical protein
MGHTHYSVDDRLKRASAAGFSSRSRDDIFSQQKERRMHESMDPRKAHLRESRDSVAHPNAIPVIISLDVTGSMGEIPHRLVIDGLPKLMGTIIQHGFPDPQVLFLAVGDHECDRFPLQVGQFESGDAELDLWLTRTYLEGNGGGNGGESYHLAYAFAGLRTAHDAWDKRQQKGLLFTIGDEPCLENLPPAALREIMMEESSQNYTHYDLLRLAQQKYEVFHLHVLQGSVGQRSLGFWQQLLGKNCLAIADINDIPVTIAQTVIAHARQVAQPLKSAEEMML